MSFGASPRFRLGQYEPLVELASGGMATVYVARQVGAAGFERLVVVKRVHRHLLKDREFYDMFRDEARVASLIHHPNVVSVTDVVESDGELFLVMDYVESCAVSTLQKNVRDAGARLPPAVAARIVADALGGLHAAHEAVDMRGERLDVVHRDVSPQNIIVGVDGTSRLIDFGIAKAARRVTETKSGSMKGKLGYMSPEGAEGRRLDRRADIFAAGVVLHEALTGRRLFQGENEFDTLRLVTETKVPELASVLPGVTGELDRVVRRALERDPARRWSTAAEFLEALEVAIAPASPREVKACLEHYCGARLGERRAELRALLEGTKEPAITGTTGEVPAAITRVLDTPAERTVSQVVTTQDQPLPRPRRVSTRALVYGSAVMGAVFAVVVATIVAGGARPASDPAPRPAPSAAPSALAEAAPPLPEELELVLVAGGPIESVRAPGLGRGAVDHNPPPPVVARGAGAQALEVVLVGGEIVHGAAEAGGPRELQLGGGVPAASKDPPSNKPPSSTKKPAGGGAPGAELHDNPYGTP